MNVTSEMVEASYNAFFLSFPLTDFRTAMRLSLEAALAPVGQAEGEASEALAYLVCNPMVAKTMLPKARGIGPEATEWLYPARREADARSMAKLMRADLIPLYPMGEDQ
jgi:hypothetical protein